MSPFQLAWLSLQRRKLPSLIALIAIAVSVATSGLLLRSYELSESRFKTLGEAGDTLVGAKAGSIEILLNALNSEGPYPDFIPWKLFETIRSEQTLHFDGAAQVSTAFAKNAVPLLFFGHYKGARVLGTEENFFQRPPPETSIHFASGAWIKNPDEVVVGSEIAKREKINLGETLSIEPWFFENENAGGSHSLKVVGILSETGSTWDRMLYTNLKTAQAALPVSSMKGHSVWGIDVIHYFFMSLHPGAEAPLKDLINKRSVAQMVTISETRQQLEEYVGIGKKLGFWLTLFVLLLGAFSVSAVLATRYESMKVQVAILRALGYERRQIFFWLGSESLLLAGTACFLGALADAALFPVIRQLLMAGTKADDFISISLWQSIPVWCVAIIATLVALVLPAVKIYQENIHAALKDGG